MVRDIISCLFRIWDCSQHSTWEHHKEYNCTINSWLLLTRKERITPKIIPTIELCNTGSYMNSAVLNHEPNQVLKKILQCVVKSWYAVIFPQWTILEKLFIHVSEFLLCVGPCLTDRNTLVSRTSQSHGPFCLWYAS